MSVLSDGEDGRTEEVRAKDPMRKYHEYLTENYVGGCNRFFSPTGFLEKFQKVVEVKSQTARNHVFVKTVDEASEKLEAALNVGADVFDLTAEPGTGKTSVLPFKFPSHKVVVALPTPFDAWNAFTMATGDCALRLKGLRLGNKEAKVVYTDSYLAAFAVLSNYMDYDIMIVDECDSDRGVSKFLAEIKTKGKLLIRMSASHGRTQAGLSRAFRVTESPTLPDIRQGVGLLADFVRDKHQGRSLVMAPDAALAKDVAKMIPGSTLVTTDTKLHHMARAMNDQKGDRIYVSDDTCGRSLNLNLDCVFDTQLISEYAVMRALTPAESYQRINRVGRNRPGWYYSSGITPVSKKTNDFDTVRHNVVRAMAEVPQSGDERLHVSKAEIESLMCAEMEPYEAKMRARAIESAVVSSGSSSGSSRRSYVTMDPPGSPGNTEFAGEVITKSISPPPWLAYYSGYSSRISDVGKKEIADTFIISNAKGHKAFARRKSSGSSSDRSSDRSISSVLSAPFSGTSKLVRTHNTPFLPTVEGAPYAVDRIERKGYVHNYDLPQAPPVMDLTGLTYEMDWPSLIRDRISRGGDLPTLVPPGSWRHTAAGGLGSDWFRRLDDLSVKDNSFEEDEFELVCRAWNKLVGQAWVKRTPGLSNVKDASRMEYCVRYFQAYFLLGSAG